MLIGSLWENKLKEFWMKLKDTGTGMYDNQLVYASVLYLETL